MWAVPFATSASRRALLSLAALAAIAMVTSSVACVGALRPGGDDPAEGAALATRYAPDRRDYTSFALAHPGLLPEPNYLPFMVHRFPRPGGLGDVLVLCRWEPSQMPIRVFVEPPEFAPEVTDEFRPIQPHAYVRSVEQALAVWEDALEGLVRFERVARPEDARLRVRLVGREAPVPDEGRRRLGTAEKLAGACRVLGWDPEAERLHVRFDMPEVVVHLADESGLLPPSIVRRLVVHELGHGLGMRGHSPSPGDVMYPELSDLRRREELSIQDVNSFVALYSVENGAHFVDAPDPDSPPPRPPPAPPGGGPDVDRSPFVDVRFGYELSVPASWMRVEEPNGVFFSDGPTWDHDASLRIFVWPAETIEDLVACCTGELLAGAWYRQSAETDFAGHRAFRLLVEDDAGERARDLLFVELPGERVMLVVAESPVGYEDAWRPWFGEILESLSIWGPSGRRPRPGDGPGPMGASGDAATDAPADPGATSGPGAGTGARAE